MAVNDALDHINMSLEQVRWLSVASIVVLALWVSKVRFAGRHFERLARERVMRAGKAKQKRYGALGAISPSRAEIASQSRAS